MVEHGNCISFRENVETSPLMEQTFVHCLLAYFLLPKSLVWIVAVALSSVAARGRIASSQHGQCSVLFWTQLLSTGFSLCSEPHHSCILNLTSVHLVQSMFWASLLSSGFSLFWTSPLLNSELHHCSVVSVYVLNLTTCILTLTTVHWVQSMFWTPPLFSILNPIPLSSVYNLCSEDLYFPVLPYILTSTFRLSHVWLRPHASHTPIICSSWSSLPCLGELLPTANLTLVGPIEWFQFLWSAPSKPTIK